MLRVYEFLNQYGISKRIINEKYQDVRKPVIELESQMCNLFTFICPIAIHNTNHYINFPKLL